MPTPPTDARSYSSADPDPYTHVDTNTGAHTDSHTCFIADARSYAYARIGNVARRSVRADLALSAIY